MKRLFTLALVMAMAVTGFAQVKSVSKNIKMNPAQQQVFKGDEAVMASFPSATRNIMVAPEVTELSFTTYDWQSNMGPRNFTAVWPDGFAVMCYTLATNNSFTDRGTGLAIWDPAVGEWEYTETRVETMPTGIATTGFGSIARYKENGLVIAAHSSNYCHLFFCEDFRNGSRDFSTEVTMPNDLGPAWPVVQCSGENLDIVHVLATEYNGASPYGDPIYYWRYQNGEWTASDVMLEALDGNHLSDGGSNITYFMNYDPAKPNRVAFILNNAWSDCKAVISEDNGETWSERVFWQHPGINNTYDNWYFYPRWTGAAFDNADNLHIVYEYNGTTGEPGSGSYYPAIGGIGYWSEVLPKNELCLGGIGNVGEPFIMDTTYLMQDIYQSEWYWDDANHDPLPEYIGELEMVGEDGNVLPRESSGGYWPSQDTWGEHGSYNGGKAAFATMHFDKARNTIYAFWSMIAGDEAAMYWNSDVGQHYLRIFCNVSYNGGITWEGTQQVLTGFESSLDEMVYDQVIPYVYNDADGDYLWVCYQRDYTPGSYVQEDDVDPTDNQYVAVKVYLNEWYDGVQENNIHAAQTMNVYPNPAQGSFQVNLNYASDVTIYNTVGQLVKTYKNVKDINVNLESGVYFVNANNQTIKVVVK
ncbi:MAG: T9SS type A sorting domain-containing protein [Bacteroidales bacterium]|nr:T9SS type A sorting domain-containing protein [Bacteroidales bacterium]